MEASMSAEFRIEAPCQPDRQATRPRPLEAMTVGELSRRTGVPVKALRDYTDTGLVNSLGRSPAGYRLFDTDAFRCLGWIATLRGLGLTVAEIRQIAQAHHRGPIGPLLAERLASSRARIQARITELEQIIGRIDAFETDHAAELAARDGDPHRADRVRQTIT
jgi:MerR family copper efflux transcriptional regulator